MSTKPLNKVDDKKARDIVAVLIKRARYAKGLVKRFDDEFVKGSEQHTTLMSSSTAQWGEAHNAAEVARRILYGHEL